jgi:Holliday junction resolvase RusA-like endonuclease
MTAKDHKRKARPIAPATVAVEPGCITVVVPDVLGKNEAHVQGADGARHTSGATKRYRQSVNDGMVKLVWASYGGRVPCQAHDGAWRLEVLGVWPTENHQVGFVAPRGDADAAIPQALDALQHAGILDDDARVVEVRAWNLYRKGVRATVMRLVRVDVQPWRDICDGKYRVTTGTPEVIPERNAALAHLLPLVPQSPEPPVKPARSKKGKP